jgi:hypothetical protein
MAVANAAVANIILHEHLADFGANNRSGGTSFETTSFLIGHLVPFFARDFASLATDAHSWISEETNLNVGARTYGGAGSCFVCLRRSCKK